MSGDVACYWEKQGGDRLCAVHCVNSLLQGPHFTEVDLGKFAQDLDVQERALLGGAAGESTNVDASGNFSIGVIMEALKKRGYQCYNTTHPAIADSMRRNPGAEAGFICNSHAREHWFTIRRVKGKWWNLDSLKHSPESIGDVYLAEFLHATQQQGFTIFVVRDASSGDSPEGSKAAELPECLPGAYSGRLWGNQFFLTAPKIEELKKRGAEGESREAAEAQRIGGGDGGGDGGDGEAGPSFTMIAPADKRKPQETDWKSLGGGQSLGGGSSSGMDDPELQAALRASALEAVQGSDAATAVQIPEEPATGTPGITTIQVRLPNGKRLQRRFLVGEHTVEQLCAFVEKSSVEDASLGLPVLTAQAYSLMKRVIPGGQLKIEREGGSTKIKAEEAGAKTLKEVGFETGGEALTLQV